MRPRQYCKPMIKQQHIGYLLILEVKMGQFVAKMTAKIFQGMQLLHLG